MSDFSVCTKGWSLGWKIAQTWHATDVGKARPGKRNKNVASAALAVYSLGGSSIGGINRNTIEGISRKTTAGRANVATVMSFVSANCLSVILNGCSLPRLSNYIPLRAICVEKVGSCSPPPRGGSFLLYFRVGVPAFLSATLL